MADKREYREWCAEEPSGRFAALRELLRSCECKPKVVICTGTGRLAHFVRAFNPTLDFEQIGSSPSEVLDHKNKKRGQFPVFSFPCCVEGCIVYVVPFLGRLGRKNLMSYDDIDRLGTWIRSRHPTLSGRA